tara:strand:- start:29 stop:244 length:216 start_codon:yes stop_codon:yes gene_type:complete
MSKQEDMNNLIDNMFMTSKQKEDIREARLYLKTLPVKTRREVYAKGMAEALDFDDKEFISYLRLTFRDILN